MPTLEEDRAEISRLTQIIIGILNSGDFSFTNSAGRELLDHISADFEALYSNSPYTLDFDGQTEQWRQDVRDYPKLHVHLLDMTTQVQRRSRTGTVHLTLAMRGIGDAQFQGACRLEWRYREDRWLLCRHVNMRGPLVDSINPEMLEECEAA